MEKEKEKTKQKKNYYKRGEIRQGSTTMNKFVILRWIYFILFLNIYNDYLLLSCESTSHFNHASISLGLNSQEISWCYWAVKIVLMASSTCNFTMTFFLYFTFYTSTPHLPLIDIRRKIKFTFLSLFISNQRKVGSILV